MSALNIGGGSRSRYSCAERAITRARNSGESSKRRMKALACFSTLAGTISAVLSSPKRKIGSRSFRWRFAASTSSKTCHRDGLASAPIHGDQPARFAIEDIDQPPRVLVADAGDDAEPLFFDCGGKLPHTKSGGVLAFVILVDNGDRKCLEELHGRTLSTLRNFALRLESLLLQKHHRAKRTSSQHFSSEASTLISHRSTLDFAKADGVPTCTSGTLSRCIGCELKRLQALATALPHENGNAQNKQHDAVEHRLCSAAIERKHCEHERDHLHE